eukprot:TRINITY_DN1860_c0_g1_i2.p5 TRINITY_DN1860_c0_g1~~TRINITY_DN1860_c0_g1_i2.p5  ORF type:complete len:133 (+),score=44.72 TRINITY_DN1860_c0_g1_i2:64-462(+)
MCIRDRYRKGACENCGAITHKTKECCERPRITGAKYTKTNIKPDELIENLKLDYDGKRDRWNGYNPDDYQQVVDEFQQYEAERRKAKQQQLDENDNEEYKKDNEFALVSSKDPRTKTTTKNLRIREDTAKYL